MLNPTTRTESHDVRAVAEWGDDEETEITVTVTAPYWLEANECQQIVTHVWPDAPTYTVEGEFLVTTEVTDWNDDEPLSAVATITVV